MHVSVENTGALERRITVEVPAARIDQEVKSRLKSLASRARFDGFRPGKAPFAVVERRFGGKVREEVLGDLIHQTFQEAVASQKLRPAGGTKIEGINEQLEKGLSYTATFEVYPEITLAPLENIKVEKPTADITEQDVDAMLETLRKQRPNWTVAERGAQTGDQLQVEFSMRIEGSEHPPGPAQQTSLMLGAGTVEKTIEERLIGAKAGEEVVIEQQLPADFRDAALAGKPVYYTFKIIAVYDPQLPAVDEDFARALGVASGSLDELRSEVRANMQRELQQAINARVKQQVLDALLAANVLEIPKALVDKEISTLVQRDNPRAGQEVSAAQSARYEPAARRRVTLGLLLAEVIKSAALKVDAARVRALVETTASAYEDPAEVIKWYYNSKERLAQVESLALEEQAVEWILERAQVSTVASTFNALMNPQPAADPA
ncbi:MAG: trigger factor [Pseudomonadota bacterium]